VFCAKQPPQMSAAGLSPSLCQLFTCELDTTPILPSRKHSHSPCPLLSAKSGFYSPPLALHLQAQGDPRLCFSLSPLCLSRQFVLARYKSIKQQNPDLPVLIREATGTPARAFARFGAFHRRLQQLTDSYAFYRTRCRTPCRTGRTRCRRRRNQSPATTRFAVLEALTAIFFDGVETLRCSREIKASCEGLPCRGHDESSISLFKGFKR